MMEANGKEKYDKNLHICIYKKFKGKWIIYSCFLCILLVTSGINGFYLWKTNHGQQLVTKSSFSNTCVFIWHDEFTNKSNDYISLINKLYPKKQLVVLCTYSGLDYCMRNTNYITVRVLLSNLCANTPVLQWILEHVKYKILSGHHYREQLLYITSLCALWTYGGLVITPMMVISEIQLISGSKEDFILEDMSGFYITQMNHPVILELMQDFIARYPTSVNNNESWPLIYEYRKNAANIARNGMIKILETHYEPLKSPYNEYAVLKFDTAVARWGGNSGDEIQTLAAIQFYPYLTTFLDRESLSKYNYSQKTIIIMNAWLGSTDMHFPDARTNISPILTSIHLEGNWFQNPGNISFLKFHSPIGARDTSTLESLQSFGIQSYFSGCATMLLKNPYLKRSDKIYAIDVPEELLRRLIPRKIYLKIQFISHFGNGTSFCRSMRAVNLTMGYYAQARLVITSRLHAAMPCVGLKTPVIFLLTSALPGGSPSRLGGLSMLWHTYNVSNEDNIGKVQEALKNFNWTSPPPNPGTNIASILKKRMLSHILTAYPNFLSMATMLSFRNE